MPLTRRRRLIHLIRSPEDAAAKMLGALGYALDAIGDALGTVFGLAADAIGDILDAVGDFIRNLADDIGDAISDFFGF